ncbi:MAG: hypothetical protein WAW86_04920 [Gammaproteobacteria bacterium]
MKKLLIVMLGFISLNTSALELSDFDCSSDQVSANGLKLILNKKMSGNKPQVYAIKNTTDKDVELNHVKPGGMGAGWTSALSAGKWSALALTEKNFNLTCATDNKATKCENLLEVCHMKAVKIKANGSYWVAENKSWDEIAEKLK